MLFELTNILTIFQKIINNILRQYLDQFVIVYLNNIIIYLNILKKHINYIFKILKYLNKRNLYLKLKNANSIKKKLTFLNLLLNDIEYA